MVKKTNNTINVRVPIKLKKVVLEIKKKQGNKTQQEVADILGINVSNVCRAEARYNKKLKN